ncbi:N-acetylmuramoyl-L-alanine amidase [Melittangium boletus]|uniref:N-acetylmuramoyl-L-alanine amidase n=1 Tax=Melittangium boletus DSM 14713 TaxID=1294270 RepID=A0A250IQE7_9BACT|nr:N-acetylmuramoyl-L-alanine amidase [Melittangium boletus]ATB33975.1 N-acetylmuramoyl-L-alanine amidase [Melittangium boletus DSM 14713]
MSIRSHLAPLLAVLLPLSAQAKQDPAEAAYQDARKSYYVLKDDAARRKLRHNWLNVARKFEAVAQHYPKSPRAPDALYTAAELLSSLSRISFVPEDQQAAIADYTRVVESHSRHRLADDAAEMLARIYFERMDQPEAARRVITHILSANPKGDRVPELKSLLASLPKAPAPAPVRAKPPAPTPAPVVASAPPVIRVELSKPVPSEPAAPQVAAAPAGGGTSPLLDAISQQGREPATRETPAAEPTPVETKPVAEAKVAEVKSVEEKPVEVTPEPKPAPAEVLAANKPVTAPVDEHMAQARLKAAAKVSGSAELTLAEQLGLKVRRVVIDAGHGGHDTGAIGRKGTREKDVTLAISRKLARHLREQGMEVLLTRDEDRYLKLEERSVLANEARGDLFISIHCNAAASSKLHGIETYTLNTSADRYSIRLAARENSTSEKGISDLQFILADLATKANTSESTRLATQVQKSLVSHLSANYSGVKNLGTKEALFYVLLGAKMPAILVETSFLSHAEEEKRLASETYQDEVAEAIAQGVMGFVGGRNPVAKAQATP